MGYDGQERSSYPESPRHDRSRDGPVDDISMLSSTSSPEKYSPHDAFFIGSPKNEKMLAKPVAKPVAKAKAKTFQSPHMLADVRDDGVHAETTTDGPMDFAAKIEAYTCSVGTETKANRNRANRTVAFMI